MTKLEAVRAAVERMILYGVSSQDPDDEDVTFYHPARKDLEILRALVDRPVTSKDLEFRVGGLCNGTYVVRESLVKEIKL